MIRAILLPHACHVDLRLRDLTAVRHVHVALDSIGYEDEVESDSSAFILDHEQDLVAVDLPLVIGIWSPSLGPKLPVIFPPVLQDKQSGRFSRLPFGADRIEPA